MTMAAGEVAGTDTRLPVWLRVERGLPGDEEIAALVAVLRARAVGADSGSGVGVGVGADIGVGAAGPGLSWSGPSRGYCPPVSWRSSGFQEAA